MRAMEHQYVLEKAIAFICGAVGGLIKLASGSMLLDVTFIGKLFEAGVTALVCGFLGVAGKYSFDWLRKKYINKKLK